MADCTPVAARRATGRSPRCTCGWRAAAAGIVAEGVAALREVGGTGPVTALIGPGARGCCYEVGEEVHAPFAGYDARRASATSTCPPSSAQQLAEQAREVHDVGLCTMCCFGLFFSHRRDGGVTGRQAGIAWRR